jgi:hypothetical protein
MLRLSYEEFVQSGKLSLIRDLKIEISLAAREEILQHKGELSEARCFLFQREIAYLFNSRLVSMISHACQSATKCKILIPKKWLIQVRQVSDFANLLKRDRLREWIFRSWLVSRGLSKIARYLSLYIFNTIKRSNVTPAQIYVVGHTQNLYQRANTGMFDFANWISLKTGQKRDVHFILEQEFIQLLVNRCRPNDLAKSMLSTVSKSIYLKQRGMGFIDTLSMFDQIFSREICSKSNLGDFKIYFTESSGGIRPYWTYGLDQGGPEVGLVNFSNSGIPKLSKGFEEYDPAIILYNWANVFCCSHRQFQQILTKSIPNVEPNLKYVGVPWYRDELTDQIPTTKNYIAVFDFETYEKHYGITTLNELGYGSEIMNEKFLLPIIDAAYKLGLTVVHKPKRKILATENTQVSPLLDRLNCHGNYIRLEAHVSPVRVITDATCVVSMPPTTTALIAKELNVPSAYFDCFGKIMADDPSLENVNLVSTEFQLEEWLRINSKS